MKINFGGCMNKMGTRSVIKFYEKENNEMLFYCAFLQIYDGYVDGVGKQLKKFIKNGKFINGIALNENRKVFNGYRDFILQFICQYKKGVGGSYLTHENDYSEYNYRVIKDKDMLIVECDEDDNYNEQFLINEEDLM